MSKTVKIILTALALLVVFYTTASVVATISQLADAVDRAYLGAGQYVFWILLAAFAGLAMAPVVLYLSLPKPLNPPANTADPLYERYQAQLVNELGRNPLLADFPVAGPDGIPAALEVLGQKADRAALEAASGTFVSTALMQNGRLDGLLVLAAQVRMVWQISLIYHLRPTPRQVLYVYSNVGAAVLVATSVDDVDFAELAAPIVSAAVPSAAGVVPGLGGISRLLVNSLAGGAANAFLTLRVAMLTKHYCAALVRPDVVEARRSASLAALALLGEVTRESGMRVAKAVMQGAGKALGEAASGIATNAMAAGAKVADVVVGAAGSVGSAVGSAASELKATSGKVIDAVGSAADSATDGARVASDAMAAATTSAGKKVSGALEATADGVKQLAARALPRGKTEPGRVAQPSGLTKR